MRAPLLLLTPLVAVLLGFVALPARAQSFQTTYDLNKAPGSAADAPNVLAYGKAAFDNFAQVVRAGDLNGDGLDDLIVGTYAANVGSPVRSQAGAVYVWFGKIAFSGTKDVAGTAGIAPDLTIMGATSTDFLTYGRALALGDINGDGVVDLLIGAALADGPSEGRNGAGEAYIVFGRTFPAAFPATLDLAIQGSAGADVTIYGASSSDHLTFGGTVATGDVNGDGVMDMFLGASDADGPADGRSAAGEAYIIFGRQSPATFPATLDLAVQGNSGANVTLHGATANDQLTGGGALLSGDFNADGVADLLIGASLADGPAEGRSAAGEAYIIFGRNSPATFPTTLDLNIQGSSGADVTLYGGTAADQLTAGEAAAAGGSPLATGDVNGDGVADVLVGAYLADGPANGRNDAGEVYIVFGRQSPASFPATLDLNIQGSSGANVTLYGATAVDTLTFGGALKVGDINGDGVGDVILGASSGDGPAGGRSSAGEAYIVFGRQSPASFPATLDLALQGNSGANVTLYGATSGDNLVVSGQLRTGDCNGDGVTDLVLGAVGGDGPSNSREDAGEAYIVLGRQSPATFPATLDFALQGNGGANVTLYGGSSGDELTYHGGLTVGDVNGDGFADVLLGAHNADGPADGRDAAGEAYAIFGIGPSAPEITVEQPANVIIRDGGVRSMTAVAAGTPVTLTFTIRNTGSQDLTGLTITKDGPDAAMFTVTVSPIAPVSGPNGSTTLTMQFAPTSSGVKTAAIHIANNDGNENPFDINLAGRGLSFNEDTDGDGLNDATEFQMAALGFDWQVSQPTLVATLFSYANGGGLYTLSQIQALYIDTPILTRDSGTGQFKLTIGIQRSIDLVDFDPFPMTSPQTVINAQGQLEFQFGVQGNTAFFLLQAQ